MGTGPDAEAERGARVSLVCCVAGIPGSGKSTLGRALAAVLGAALLDQDTATNPLLAEIARLVGAGDDWDHPALRGSVRRARYGCLLDVAAENVQVGRPVVMVAPFTSEVSGAKAWAELTGRFAGVPVRLVWVSVSAVEAQRRRRSRNLPRDAAWVDADADALPAPSVPAVEYLAADGAADPAAEAARLAALLRSS